MCKANIVMLKGINDEHIETVVKAVQELHCEITNIMQMIPVKGSVFEHMPLVSNKEVMVMRKKCESHMKQMYHCRQCRADAIGTLEKDVSLEFCQCLDKTVATEITAYQRVAVASQSGILVDQHFGQAVEFFIYDSDGDTVKFGEKRETRKYCNGPVACDYKNKTNKTDKIDTIINMIKDCRSVLAVRIGAGPTARLEEIGITAIPTYDRVEEAVKKAVNQVNISLY